MDYLCLLLGTYKKDSHANAKQYIPSKPQSAGDDIQAFSSEEEK